MKKEKFAQDKGVTTTDIVVAIIVIILFVSIITTAFYNYYLSIQSKNRATIATNIVIDTIESVETLQYDNVNEDSINSIIEKFKQDGTIPSGYELTATIQNYNETEGNTTKQDLIKILNVKVTYLLNNKEENIEITRLITK